jgi:hypothetical protein
MKTTKPISIARKTCRFGPVWTKAILAGTVTDHDKLIAHAKKLEEDRLKVLEFNVLLAEMQAKLASTA